MGGTSTTATNHVAFIWNIAESLRGPFKPNEYGDVVLPFTVLRRMESVLADTKPQVLDKWSEIKDTNLPAHMLLPQVSGHQFYNTSPYDLNSLVGDSEGLRPNISAYLEGFSSNVRDIFDRFNFEKTLDKLAEKNKLLAIVQKFAATNLHPNQVSNIQMGQIFEELIRKFNENSNETAGDHFTPREVIRLMVDLLFALDGDALTKPGVTRSIYDPTVGTGGMLSVADDYLRSMNNLIDLNLYGQDYNDMSYAICKADMIIKGQGIDNIVLGNTLTEDGFAEKRFDYAMSNPPFGVDWKDEQLQVVSEHEKLGFVGRFGPGVPRVSDGSLLFLLHLVSKMRPVEEGGSRIGIVLNGSPLFSGGAGSGESNIRKWLLDQDLIEAIIALPKDMFYNTGIATYIWILTNKKAGTERAGKVQLIDGSGFFQKMRKGIGSKRNEMSVGDIREIVSRYSEFEENGVSKIFDNSDFLYRTITVERPLRLNFQASAERIEGVFEQKPILKLSDLDQDRLRIVLEKLGDDVIKSRPEFTKLLDQSCDAVQLKLPAAAKKAVLAALSEQDDTADICKDVKGRPEPDPSLRDNENILWHQGIDEYFDLEVKPFAPEAWVDHAKTKDGAEIPFTRHFYVYSPPRPVEEIDAELNEVLEKLRTLLVEVEK